MTSSKGGRPDDVNQRSWLTRVGLEEQTASPVVRTGPAILDIRLYHEDLTRPQKCSDTIVQLVKSTSAGQNGSA